MPNLQNQAVSLPRIKNLNRVVNISAQLIQSKNIMTHKTSENFLIITITEPIDSASITDDLENRNTKAKLIIMR